MAPRYHVNVFWYEPDGCWVADVPDLKSCSAFGDTRLEALTEVQIAMELWLDVAKERGLPIPEARYHPEFGKPRAA